MKTTTRIYYRTLVLALVIAVTAVSLATQPALAQTREIPAYVQIRLESVIKDAAAQGDAIRIDKMDLHSIVALLDNKNHRVASSAAYALGEIRDPEAIPALVAALNSDRDHMRRIAAHALGKIGDSRAVMPLIEAPVRRDPAGSGSGLRHRVAGQNRRSPGQTDPHLPESRSAELAAADGQCGSAEDECQK